MTPPSDPRDPRNPRDPRRSQRGNDRAGGAARSGRGRGSPPGRGSARTSGGGHVGAPAPPGSNGEAGRYVPRPIGSLKPLDEEERRVTGRQAASPLKRLEDEEREDARRRETVRVGIRLSAMGVVVLGLFSVMVFRLWSLQVLNSSSARNSVLATTTRDVPISPPRGLIEARGGQVIVSNEVQSVVTLNRQVAATNPGVVQRLAIVLGLSVKDIQAAINDQQNSIYAPVPVLVGVPGNVIVYLSEHKSMFPGVTVSYVAERQYPYGSLASQTLGYVADITGPELKQLKHHGYNQGDVLGQSGVEASYEHYLRGKAGVRQLLVDAAGDPVGTAHVKPATPGDTVVLSLDLGLQQAAESDLQAELSKLGGQADSGAVVALDPRNGQILAMASAPTYDPSWWVGGMSTAHYQQLTSTSSHFPLLNRAIQGQYPPGSTFKLATATAALDTGLISPYTLISDPGQFTIPGCQVGCVFHNNESESCGACNVVTALTMSDDVFFYTLGYRFYVDPQQFGNDAIQRYAAGYGLGANSGIDLPGALPGQVDSPQLRQLQHKEAPKAFPDSSYSVGDAINTAFGQGETVVTPLELANAYATFANGGTRYAPEIASEIVTPNGKVVKKIEPKVMAHVSLPPATRQAIESGLDGVTTATGPEGGTATAALQALHYPFSKLPIAGKTGTSQVSASSSVQPDSLFVAYGPTADPRYVIACIIPNGGYGASAAAPVVIKLFEYLIAHPVGSVTPKAAIGVG